MSLKHHRTACFVKNIVLLSLLSSVCFASEVSQLSVRVAGFANDTGVARIAVFSSPVSYKNDNTTGNLAFRKCAVKIHNQVAKCTFTVPYGTYAIKTYHDMDNSGSLKTGMFGIPQEGYGFSNNPQNQSGARSWGNAVVTISKPRVAETITLIGDQ